MDVADAVQPARSAAENALPPAAVALDRLDDVEERHRARRSGETIAAGSALGAVDEAGQHEVPHHLPKKPRWDRPLGRDPTHAQARVRTGARESEGCPDRVVGALRELESHAVVLPVLVRRVAVAGHEHADRATTDEVEG